jgi:penicillin-binding protein 2
MYKFRLKILLLLTAVSFGILLVRLGMLQLAHGAYYREEAARRLQKYEFTPGMRGRIMDRHGVILAEDQVCHNFSLDYAFIAQAIAEDEEFVARVRQQAQSGLGSTPEERLALDAAADRARRTKRLAKELAEDDRWKQYRLRDIRRALGLDRGDPRIEEDFSRRFQQTCSVARSLATEFDVDLDETMSDILWKYRRWELRAGRPVREQFMAHAVVTGLMDEHVHALRPMLSDLLGATLDPSHRRYYPHGDTACHIIGYTGRVFADEEARWNLREDQADWLRRRMWNYFPGDTIGKTGVEAMGEYIDGPDGAVEPFLRPIRGYVRYRKPGDVAEIVPPQDGRDVHLTIDIELQKGLTDLLRADGKSGAIVVIDIARGEILAMVSWPTFDLNTYRQQYARLVTDTANLPLHHRAVANGYPPGSTVKPLTGLVGLQEGLIRPNEELNCPGYVKLDANGNKILRCWYRLGHGPLCIREAIKKSCTVFFPKLSDRIGTERLLDWFQRFGFNRKPGTGLPEENAGLLGTRDWLMRNRKRGFWPSDKWFMSVGQGIFSATPLQIANAHATLARRGVFLSPRIALEAVPLQQRRDLQLRSRDVDLVWGGMHDVVNDRNGGTAYKGWHLGEPLDVTVCGKTGTAQSWPLRIDSDEDGRITQNDQIVKEGDHAWFAGFGPYRAPQVAVSVIVEYAGSGGTHAAPVAKEVFRMLRQFGYVEGD